MQCAQAAALRVNGCDAGRPTSQIHPAPARPRLSKGSPCLLRGPHPPAQPHPPPPPSQSSTQLCACTPAFPFTEGLLPELLGLRACEGCLYMQRWVWVLAVAALAAPLIMLRWVNVAAAEAAGAAGAKRLAECFGVHCSVWRPLLQRRQAPMLCQQQAELLCCELPPGVPGSRDMNKIARASAVGDVSVGLLTGLACALAIAAARGGQAHPLPWGPEKERLGLHSEAMLVLQASLAYTVVRGLRQLLCIACRPSYVQPYKLGCQAAASLPLRTAQSCMEHSCVCCAWDG